MPFCMRDRVQFNGVNRGPFKSSREWLRAQLDIIQLECKHHLEKDDEDDEDDDDDEDSSEEEEDTLQARSKLIKRLILLLPKFIPKIDDSFVERTVLCHPDLSLRNILVDEEGTITAVLDWENSACLATWATCDVPSLLEGKSWHSHLNLKDYIRGEEESLYKERSNWYQQTGLRETFLSCMKLTYPSWIEIYENSEVQRDFRRAVELCDYDPA